MIDANTEIDADAVKSLKTWIHDSDIRMTVYQSIKKINVLMQRNKMSNKIAKVANQELSSVHGELIVATIKQIESLDRQREILVNAKIIACN